MKIVLAFDSFKGSLPASEACAIVRKALLSIHPDWTVVSKPMADGGEGTAEAMRANLSGRRVRATVMGPLPRRRVRAGFVWFPATRTAVVEMAAASGLTLLRRGELNPLKTTTYGTGMLIAAAARKGARKIWLAVGGSATVDGGVGAAMALGWRFLDARGREIGLGGGELARIETIVPPATRNLPPVEVLCDVNNPLTGPRGAARVYGPQKGATPAGVAQLDAGLKHLAGIVNRTLGRQIDIPGGGAAGGLAAGAVAFLNATLVSGADAVMRAGRLDESLRGADWVITGEGQFDRQSLQGKVVSGIARTARKRGVQVAVIAGSVKVTPARYRRAGIQTALALRRPGMTLEKAISAAPVLLADCAARLVGTLAVSFRVSPRFRG